MGGKASRFECVEDCNLANVRNVRPVNISIKEKHSRVVSGVVDLVGGNLIVFSIVILQSLLLVFGLWYYGRDGPT